MGRPFPVLAAMILVLVACGEESRRAPAPASGEEDDAGPAAAAGPLRISEDGRAVLLGRDTLLTAGRLPGGSAPDPTRLSRVSFSPDSTLVAYALADGGAGIWSRTAQIARPADVFPGGGVDSMAWAPEGVWLAWSGRSVEEIPGVGVSDAIGRRQRHPILEWLYLQGRSATSAGWIDEGRLRVEVASARGEVGSQAYVWDLNGRHFTLEEHLEPLIERAPGAPPVPGGVFSLDLGGGDAPETVALFRSPDGAPAALVLEGRDGRYRARVTDPLVEPADLGLPGWEEGSGTVRLYAPARLASGPALLITLPSTYPGLAAVGLFRLGRGGALEPITAATPEGERMALFLDGRSGDESHQLGIVDLDGDGTTELVSAVGRPTGDPAARSARWRATVFHERGGRLMAAPELEGAALERIAEASVR